MNKIVRQDICPTFYEDTNLLARRDPDPIFFLRIRVSVSAFEKWKLKYRLNITKCFVIFDSKTVLKTDRNIVLNISTSNRS